MAAVAIGDGEAVADCGGDGENLLGGLRQRFTLSHRGLVVLFIQEGGEGVRKKGEVWEVTSDTTIATSSQPGDFTIHRRTYRRSETAMAATAVKATVKPKEAGPRLAPSWPG